MPFESIPDDSPATTERTGGALSRIFSTDPTLLICSVPIIGTPELAADLKSRAQRAHWRNFVLLSK